MLAILTFTVVVNLGPYGNEKRRVAFESDLRSLKEEVDQYYARYGELPILKDGAGKEVEYDESSEDFNKILDEKDWNILNINDRVGETNNSPLGTYYVIDTDLLDVDLNYKNETFIINSESHTVYLPEGVIYAEGVGEDYEEDKVHYRISEIYTQVSGDQADQTAPEILRVDQNQTVRYLKMSEITSKSFKVTAKAQDKETGLYKLVFHCRRTDGEIYRTIEHILPREDQGTTEQVTITEAFNDLKTGENANEYVGEFLVYVEAYDMSGNKVSLETDPEPVVLPPVDAIEAASLSTEDWTNQNIIVTLPVAPVQFSSATGNNAYKKTFITQYKKEGDTEWTTYFNPATDTYDSENPPTIEIDRLTTLKYRYTDGINGGPENTKEIDKIDKVPPTVDVDPETPEIDDSRNVTYGESISVKVQDLQDIAQWYGASGVSQWQINQSATTPSLEGSEWQDLTQSQTIASTTSEGHIINIVTKGTPGTYKDVGTYYIWAKDQAQNINIQIAQVVINPKTVSGFEVEIEQNEYTYDGTPKTPGVTVKDEGVVLNGCLEGEDTTGKDYIITYRENVEAGTATVVITGTGNYTGQADLATFTIKKATPTITLDPTSSEINYNEEKTFTATTKVTNAPAVEGTVTATSGTPNKVEITGGATTPNVNATTEGTNTTITYRGAEATDDQTTITVTFTPSDTRNYETVEATFTVTKVNKITNPITVTPKELTYNGEEQSLVTTTNAEGEVWYSIGTPLTAENCTREGIKTIPKQTNAGEYEVYYYTPGNTNYLPAEGHTTVRILPKTLTVENFDYAPLTKPYDGTTAAPANFAVTATPESGLVAGDIVNVTYTSATYNDPTVANANKITVTGIAIDNPNYTLDTTTCEKAATITPLSIAGSVTITGENIYGSTLTAVVSDLNPADATLTYQWFSSDSETTTGGTPLTEPSPNSTYTIGEGLVGKYIYVIATASKENYNNYEMKDITDETQNRTETVAPKKITPPTPTDKTYNGQEQTSYEGTLDYTVTGNKATNAGTYEGTAELTDKENTVWADNNRTTDKTLSWIINPVEIEVTWGSQTSFTYNGEPQAPTVTQQIHGVNGETITISVSGAQTNTGNYTATANIASVTLQNGDPGTQENIANYTIKEETKTKDFTIANAEITGQFKITGTNTVGETLTATKVSLDPDDADLTYQWYVSDNPGTTGGTPIPGATGREYIPTEDQVGKHIYVEVTAQKDNYNPKTFTDETDVEENASATVFKVTVTLNPNGGEVTPTTLEVSYNSPYGELPTPTRTGYTFDGWYTEATNGTKVETTTLVATTQSHTIYAHWNANTYNIVYDGNGATSGSTEAQNGVEYDQDVTLNENGFNKEYTVTYEYNGATGGNSSATSTTSAQFLGWTLGSENLLKFSDLLAHKNMTINPDGTLSCDLDNTSGTDTIFANEFFNPNNKIKTSTNYVFIMDVKSKSSEGSSANGLRAGDAGTGSDYFNDFRINTGNIIIGINHLNVTTIDDFSSATYALRAYTRADAGSQFAMTYRPILIEGEYTGTNLYYYDQATARNLATEGTVTLYSDWAETEAITLPTPTKTGYAFAGWYTDSALTQAVTLTNGKYTPTENTTLYAKWTAEQYTVTFDDNYNMFRAENKTQDGLAISFDAETSTLTLNGTITANDGKSIKLYWYKNLEFVEGETYKYTLTPVSGSITGNEIVGLVADIGTDSNKQLSPRCNNRRNLIPTVGEGFDFTVTANAASQGSSLYIWLWLNKSETEYTFNNYKVKVDLRKTSSKEVTYDDAYGTMPTTKRTGYTFDGWHTEATNGAKVEASTIVKTAQSHTLYAHWTPYTYKIEYYNGTDKLGESEHTYDAAKTLTPITELTSVPEGYTFVGWATENGNLTPTYTNGQSITNLSSTNDATIPLYAVWERTVKFYSGNSAQPTTAIQHINGETYSVDAPAPTPINGWDAQGWRDDTEIGEKEYGSDQPETITANAGPNFYAVYTRTVHFYSGISSAAHEEKTQYHNNGSDGIGTYSVTAPTPATIEDWTIVGWRADGNPEDKTYNKEEEITDNVGINFYGIYSRKVALDYEDHYIASVMVITLDSQNAETTGTETIYQHKGVKYSLSSGDNDEEMTTTENPVTPPTKTGYSFVGYYTEPNGQGTKYINEAGYLTENADNKHFTSAGTLYAKWEERRYTLTANAEGGTIPATPATQDWTIQSGNQTATKTVTYDQPYGTLPTPTKPGYIFEGWYTEENGEGTEITEQTIVKITEDTTLHAKWTACTYKIEYYKGTRKLGETQHTYDVEQNLKPIAELGGNSLQPGYEFAGWSKDPDATTIDFNDEEPVKNLTETNGETIPLYAVWQRTAYFYSGNSTEPQTATQYLNGETSTVEAPAPTPIDNWQPQGWRDDTEIGKKEYGSDQAETIIENAGPNFYAVYTRTAHFYSGINSVTHEEKTQYHNNGSDGIGTYSVTSPTPTKIEGWTTLGWRADGNPEDKTYNKEEEITDNVGPNFYAVYDRDITINYGDHYIAEVATITLDNQDAQEPGTTTIYEHIGVKYSLSSADNDEEMTPSQDPITPPAKEGYTFGGYYTETNGEGTQYISETGYLTENADNQNFSSAGTLYAKWIQNYTIHYYNGETELGTSVHIRDRAKNLTTIEELGATENGYTFAGWSIASNTLTVKYTDGESITNLTNVSGGTINLYAVWQRTVNFYSGNSSEPATAIQYKNGENYAVEAPAPTPIEGWKALGWRDDTQATGKQYGSDQPETITGNVGPNFYAVYTRTANFYSGANKTLKTKPQYKNGENYSVEAAVPEVIETWTPEYWRATSKEVHYPLTGEITNNVGPNFYAVYSRDITLEYQKKLEKNITVSFETGIQGQSLDSKQVAYNGNYGELPTPERENYTLGGWYTGENGTGTKVTPTTTVAETAEHTLYAKWIPNEYTIKYNLEGGTNANENPETYNIETQTITLVDATRAGYTFTGWTGEGTTTPTKNLKIQTGSVGNRTYTANWMENNYQNVDKGIYYDKLSSALEDVENNQTIIVLNSRTETTELTLASGKEEVKLDMNGQTTQLNGVGLTNKGTLDIYNSSSTEGKLTGSGRRTITNSGTLTTNGTSSTNKLSIENSSTEPANSVIYNNSGKTVTLNTNTVLTYTTAIIQPESASSRPVIRNGGTLRIQGATITNNISGTTYDMGIHNGASARTVINSGTISTYGGAIYSTGTGTTTPTVEISGTNEGTLIISSNSYGIRNNAVGTVSISGGTISSNTSYALYNTSKGTIDIAEGNIIATSNAIRNANEGTITVSGGTISGTIGIYNAAKGKINVRGNSTTITGTTSVGIRGGIGEVKVEGGTISGKTDGLTITTEDSVSGTAIVTGGLVEGERYGAYVSQSSTLTMGTNDSSVSTTSPVVQSIGTTGATGVVMSSPATFNFYDGKVIGTKSINRTESDKPDGYEVVKTTENGTETAILRQTYTIAYEGMDGASYGAKHPTIGTYQVEISNPTKTGYTFTGWTTNASSGLEEEAKTGTTANPSTPWTGTATTNTYFKTLRNGSGTVTLTATWIENNYQLVKVQNNNILTNSGFEAYTIEEAPSKTANGVTHTWDGSLNGIPNDASKAYYPSSWGTGANMNTALPEIGYHAHMKIVDENAVFDFKTNEDYAGKTIADINDGITVGEERTMGTNRWLGTHQEIEPSKLTAGKTYTITMDVYRVSGTSIITAGLHYATGTEETKSFASGKGRFNPSATGVWETISWTFTIDSNYNSSVIPHLYIYGHEGGAGRLGELYVDNVILEEVTPTNKTYTTAYTAEELETPTKAGYTFDGWYSDATFTTELSTSNIFNTSTAKFEDAETEGTPAYMYAKWTENT